MKATPIEDIYAREFACLDELALLLASERDALKSRDTSGIHAATETKQELLRTLDTLDQQRQSLISEYSAQARNDPAIAEWIETNDHRLEEALREFQHANRINMGIVELGQLFTEQMLTILRGQSRSAWVYDLQGGREKTFHSKSLAKV